MKKLIGAVALLLCCAAVGEARSKLQDYCQDGGKTVTTASIQSTTKVQQSFPSCTVTVFNGGTVTLATIFADNAGTPKANPFTAASDGLWFFYAADGRYDVQFSGGGITTPFTRGDYTIFDFTDAFLNGGNTFTTPFGTLGTKNGLDLAIITNNIERARITGGGVFNVENGPLQVTGSPGSMIVGGPATLSNNLTVALFSAFGGAAINNNDTVGYVGIHYDHTYTSYGNEVRGIQATVRTSRVVPDALWDVFGIDAAVVVDAANNQHLTGQRKGVVAELYFSPNTYTVDTAFNFQGNIPTLGSGVTVTNWYGMIVNSPASGGTISNGYGLFIDNLDNGAGTIGNAAAIKIGGINNFGRIIWPGTNLTDIGGALQVGSGLVVGAGGTLGLNAGSFAISGTTIIDGSRNVSTTGFGNFDYLQMANANARATPAGGFTRIYPKSDATDPVGSKKLYYKDSGGNEYTVCTTGTCAGGGSGVSSLNTLTGSLTLAAGANVTITPSGGNTLTIASGTGGSGVAGNGTTNQITKWTNNATPGTIGDSILAEVGGNTVTLTGVNAFSAGDGGGTANGGYYVGNKQIITGLSGGTTASMGNVNALTAVGTLSTSGHFDATGASGDGYWLNGTQAFYIDSGTPHIKSGLKVTGGGLTVGAGSPLDQGVNAGTYSASGTQITTALSGGTVSLQNINAITAAGTILTTGHADLNYTFITDQAGAPSGVATKLALYSKTADAVGSKLVYYKDSGGNEYTFCNTATCPGGGGGGVSGSGTLNTVPKWSNSANPGSLTNSIITEVGGNTVTVTGTNAFSTGDGSGGANGGYYVGSRQIITGLSGGTTASLGNVNAIQAIGTITTRGAGGTSTGHFDTINDGASTGLGGYYISGTRMLYGFNADTVLTASGGVRVATGFAVKNDGGTYFGADAGSYAISGATVINSSQQVIVSGKISSAVGYQINQGNAAVGHVLCGNGTLYVDCSPGTGITSLNGLTNATQTFAVGTGGTDFNISSTSSTHTFNIPDASASARGLVSTGSQTFGGAKTFNSQITASAGIIGLAGIEATGFNIHGGSTGVGGTVTPGNPGCTLTFSGGLYVGNNGSC